jgi:hypothetical protein
MDDLTFTSDLTKKFIGLVVDNNDPLKIGRCKVKVFGKFDDIPNEDIPWAFPMYSAKFASSETGGFGSFSYPKLNSLVTIEFVNNDLYTPQYKEVEKINTVMQTEINDDYINSQVIIYDVDEDMKIIYLQGQGLMLWHKGSLVNIDKEKHIRIHHVDESSTIDMVDGEVTEHADDKWSIDCKDIHLGSTNAGDKAVLCSKLGDLLGQLATIIDSKVPQNPGATQLISSMKSSLCSEIVHIDK